MVVGRGCVAVVGVVCEGLSAVAGAVDVVVLVLMCVVMVYVILWRRVEQLLPAQQCWSQPQLRCVLECVMSIVVFLFLVGCRHARLVHPLCAT